MCAQLSPPSVDLYTPFPMVTLERMWGSPVPAHTIFESDVDTAKAPTEWTSWSSKSGSQRIPPSSVFQSPPEAAPA